MRRANWLAPLLAVVLLLALLGVLFGPGLYRSWRFNQTCLELLRDAREGRLAEVSAALEPAQQAQVGDLFNKFVPADYAAHMESLKLTSWRNSDDDKIWAIVTCRITQGEGFGIYQAKLRWHWHDGRWWLDFLASYGAEFSPSGEPDWIELSQLVELAELL